MGRFVFVGIFLYVIVALFCFVMVEGKTNRRLYPNLVIVFFFLLIPLWNVIIGYPIY